MAPGRLVVAVLGCCLLGAGLRPGAEAVAAPSPGVTLTTPMSSPAGFRKTGPRPNGTAVLPDGRVVTPVGTQVGVDPLPLNLVLSADGKRLYVSSEGGDGQPSETERDYNRFISVIDTTTLAKIRVKDDALQYGLAEVPARHELLVSEGETGKVGVFSTTGTPRRVGEIALDPLDFPWGLQLMPGGAHALAVGFRGNSLSVLDVQTRTRVARVATGQYPFTVAVAPDGKSAWVSNWGMFNPEADDVASNVDAATVPPVTIGGYNTDESSSLWQYDLTDPTAPTVLRKVQVGHLIDGYDVIAGSLPSAMAFSPDGRTLAVTASNNDLVLLIDPTTGEIRKTVSHLAIDGGPTGTQPNALAWSPDGAVLYVAEGGHNAVAVVDPAAGVITGRIPTAWYPSALALSKDGRTLWVANAKGLGAGPNGVSIDGAHKAQRGSGPSYIGNLLKGTVQRIDLATSCPDLARLGNAVNANDGLRPGDGGDGSVVPTAYGTPSDKIKHVVFILKENRTYDQIFGDLAGTERDQRLAFYGGKVTPNHHAAATEFAHGQNYYNVGQDSFDGHFVIGTGHVNEFDQKLHPTVWNANKLGPEGLYVSAPENLPEGGFMWNNLYRHGVSFRVYGEATFLIGLGPTVLTPPSELDPANPRGFVPALFALQNNYSLTYPSQITPSRPAFGEGNTDEDRADDFLRELALQDAAGVLPSFLFLWLTDDHTQGTTPGALTPESEVARNDRAMGRILEGLTHSRFWDDMAIFVTEDDPQDGQDHVDAHRTIQLVLSPYAKRGYAATRHHSNLSTLKTIDLLLGVPPNSIQEMSASSLSDYFTATPNYEPYVAKPLEITYEENPPASAAPNALLRQAAKIGETLAVGIDEAGPEMQKALVLRHEGALAAGNPNIPATPDIQERRLDDSSPAAVQPRSAPAANVSQACLHPAVLAAPPVSQPNRGPLPATGLSWPFAAAGAALLAGPLLFRRRVGPRAR